MGPACTRETLRQVKELMALHGWRLTVDLFAVQSNAMAARFVSWTDEPHSDSEYVDAFSLGNWSQSMCACCREHRETAFIFPPSWLEKVAVLSDKLESGPVL